MLNDVAAGELDYTLTYDYAGELSKIEAALEQISSSFNATLLQINRSSDQAGKGFAVVADKVRNLANLKRGDGQA